MMQSQLTLSQVSWGVGCLVKDHSHQQQNKIMEICMKQGCTLPNILCTFCKKLHNDHREKLVSIAEIEEEFKNAQQDIESKKLLLLIEQFEQFARKQLEVMVKKMKMLDNPFNVLDSIIMKNNEQSYSQLKDHVSELLKLIEFDNFKVKFKQPDYLEINIQINNLANQYLSELTNFMKQNGILGQPPIQSSTQKNNILIIQKQQEQQQNNVLTGVQIPKIKDFYFLQQDCGIKIKCITRYCVRNIYKNDQIVLNRGQMAYLNRNLEYSEGASLIFKINAISSDIGIGICQLEKVSKQNNESYCGFGSGLYFAESYGYIYNSDYEEYNDKGIEHFKMEQGKKYRFTFDPGNKKRKQFALEQIDNSVKQQLKQENKITMPIKIDYSYHYRIFVCLLGQGSEIELINQ